ncbi:MAG: hypothetical protein IPK59_16680 [Rhodospirillaceae bacterium]|nr:hypothetical protein [Rhodospirillaceae bacterium]
MRRGRNVNQQTTKNWPDACVSTGDGEVDGIEATRQDRWADHLEEDLKKARGYGNDKLTGYFFVGGNAASKPSAEDVPNWTNKFAALGIPRDRITLLIGNDLVSELERPEYAQILLRRLGIVPVSCWYEPLGRSEIIKRPLGAFGPSMEEFVNGQVGAPAILVEVETRLVNEGVAFVRGYGAAGKTTLAYLIGLSIDRAPMSVWYCDLATKTDAPSAIALNELVELAGPGALFIVDNVHIDETLAARIEKQWRDFAKVLGATLFLLGRVTTHSKDGPLDHIESIELRAGFDEMRSVVRRLAARSNAASLPIADEVVAKWAGTFGGNEDPDKTAVDLIAFTASVDRRLCDFIVGDYRLSAADAIDGIRARYLQPLADDKELGNLLALATLAEFEIEATDDLLPNTIKRLDRSTNELGIVLHGQNRFNGGRTYRLIHAAIGDLLLQAAGNAVHIETQLAEICSRSPATGLRIMAALRKADDESDRISLVERCILDALAEGDIARDAANLYELAALVRHALTTKIRTPQDLDRHLAKSMRLFNLLESVRDLWGVTNFLSWISKLGLSAIADLVCAQAAAAGTAAHEAIYRASVIDACALIRTAPSPHLVLHSIAVERWSEGHAISPSQPIGEVVGAITYLEDVGFKHLATSPALRQVSLAEPRQWSRCDLSHLSHLVRLSQCSQVESNHLVEVLAESGWIHKAFEDGPIGSLCGALLSLANHAPSSLRAILLVPSLDSRVAREIHAPREGRAKRAARGICLAGAYSALGGRVAKEPPLSMEPATAEWFLNDLIMKKRPSELGMYELQFWLGLKALYEAGIGPSAMKLSLGEAFLAKLTASTVPTSQAAVIKQELVAWLNARKADGWLKDL